MKHFFSIFVIVFCFAAVSLMGCSESNIIDTEAVTGTVTFNGQPLEGASVSFSPKVSGQGTPATGITDTQGNYVLQTPLGAAQAGTSQGEYIVLIRKYTAKSTGQKLKNERGGETEMTQPVNILPEIYADPTKTPLSASVKSGKNTYDFDLKDQ
ncbi:MAG: carboxypeptidase-like regulatory domain-containing protein [Planctomycetaceae bacterium]|jgi:hypothetical protein|nr:carboxypeptidase-like regulatory domain-containing protein [Planctomycetaceae bacterium]